jgi:beta-galactosidase GanA
VVRFVSATGQFLNLPNFCSGFTAGDGVILFKRNADPPGAAADTGLWGFGADTSNSHVPWTDGTIYENFGTTGRMTTANPTPSLTSWTLYEVSSAAGAWTSRVNNSVLYTTGTNTVGFRTNPLVGSSDGSSVHMDGDIAEVLIYDHAIDSTERAAIVAYINSKYGLSF